MNPAPEVHKFGGTSVGSAPWLRRAVTIAAGAARRGRAVIVVSALARVTDALVHAADRAAGGDAGALAIVPQLARRHARLYAAVAGAHADTNALDAALAAPLAALEAALADLLAHGPGAHARAAVLAAGERLSAPLFAALLRLRGIEAESHDARDVLRAHGAALEAEVDGAASTRLAQAWWAQRHTRVAVVTGFVAGDAEGRTVLLGRGGSDTSATWLAAALGAPRVTLWTDVAGIYSADPREIADARVVRTIDAEGATLLARHGARVLHPRALEPARTAGVEVHVRVTRQHTRAGTRVTPARSAAARRAAPVVASDRGLARLHVRTAMSPLALTSALQARAVPVLGARVETDGVALFVPASSAHCAHEALSAIGSPGATLAERDRAHALVTVVTAGPDASLPARITRVLAAAGVRAALAPVRTTPRSTSVAVTAAARERAVRALHAAFAPARPRADVLLIGAGGRVARALVQQLAAGASTLPKRTGLELRVIGAAGRTTLLWDERGVDPATLAERFAQAPASESGAWLARALEPRERPLLVIDATASEEVAAHYPALLAAGVSIVTPNKRANARSHAFWRALRTRARASGAAYRDSTTVGAGLPVLAAVRALRERGDALLSLEAVLSGSVSAILHAVQAGTPFARAVAEAHAQGLTEPHPAEDLSGEDVARKLLIVLREAGFALERRAIAVTPLARPGLRAERDPARFLNELSHEDRLWAARAAAAAERGERLVLVARFDGRRASVAVESLPESHPLARTRARENVIVLRSRHHDAVPLTLAGPGAGAELTAAGVLMDAIDAARHVLARRAAVRPKSDRPLGADSEGPDRTALLRGAYLPAISQL